LNILRYFSNLHPDLIARIPYVFLILSLTSFTLQMIGVLLIFDAPEQGNPLIANDTDKQVQHETININENTTNELNNVSLKVLDEEEAYEQNSKTKNSLGVM
jgi:hypothetical protein